MIKQKNLNTKIFYHPSPIWPIIPLVSIALVTFATMELLSQNFALLKEPGLIISDFFKLSEILVSEESSYISHYPGEFYSWKMHRLEDINENVTSYGKGNHN